MKWDTRSLGLSVGTLWLIVGLYYSAMYWIYGYEYPFSISGALLNSPFTEAILIPLLIPMLYAEGYFLGFIFGYFYNKWSDLKEKIQMLPMALSLGIVYTIWSILGFPFNNGYVPTVLSTFGMKFFTGMSPTIGPMIWVFSAIEGVLIGVIFSGLYRLFRGGTDMKAPLIGTIVGLLHAAVPLVTVFIGYQMYSASISTNLTWNLFRYEDLSWLGILKVSALRFIKGFAAGAFVTWLYKRPSN